MKRQCRGGLPEMGAWQFFRLKWGGAVKKEVVTFQGGWYPNAHYESEIAFKLSAIVLLKLMFFIRKKIFAVQYS